MEPGGQEKSGRETPTLPGHSRGESTHYTLPHGWLADRKVDVRLSGKENPDSHGARPVHQIISMVNWIRTSRLSINNSLSPAPRASDQTLAPDEGIWAATDAVENATIFSNDNIETFLQAQCDAEPGRPPQTAANSRLILGFVCVAIFMQVQKVPDDSLKPRWNCRTSWILSIPPCPITLFFHGSSV